MPAYDLITVSVEARRALLLANMDEEQVIEAVVSRLPWLDQPGRRFISEKVVLPTHDVLVVTVERYLNGEQLDVEILGPSYNSMLRNWRYRLVTCLARYAEMWALHAKAEALEQAAREQRALADRLYQQWLNQR